MCSSPAKYAVSVLLTSLSRTAPPDIHFWFLPADKIVKGKERTLPNMQELRNRGWLVQRDITFPDACQGMFARDHLAISHRWETSAEPDVEGTQLQEIRRYLKSHPNIKWVWFDFWCMPQGQNRSAADAKDFKSMLHRINSLYLGMRVLILLDLSYMSRFWVR